MGVMGCGGGTSLPPIETFDSFNDWCTHRRGLSPEQQIVVNVLLDQVNHQNCNVAEAKLKTLTKLDLSGQGLTDISPLARLPQLTKLDLGNNQITNISPLTRLNQLEDLVLDSNQIAHISTLRSLTNLTHLRLSQNEISDITSLDALTTARVPGS